MGCMSDYREAYQYALANPRDVTLERKPEKPRNFSGVSVFVHLVRSLIGLGLWRTILNDHKLVPVFWARMRGGMQYSDFDALLAQCVELGVLRKQTLSLTLEGVEPSPIEVVCVGIGENHG